jgi:murein L,D-transpeptidase YafK
MKKYVIISILWVIALTSNHSHNLLEATQKIPSQTKGALFSYKGLGKLSFYNSEKSIQITSAKSLKAFSLLCKKNFADTIIVYKTQRKMQLYQGLKLIKEYKVSLGFDPQGHKLEEGDGKTPEGSYKIVGKNPQSKFHRSLQISYPNQQDIAAAKEHLVSPGGAIMIHGVKKEYIKLGKLHSLKDWTHGCIAVTNTEIEEVWELTPLGAKIFIIDLLTSQTS